MKVRYELNVCTRKDQQDIDNYIEDFMNHPASK